VVVWLGEAHNGSDQALEILRKLTADYELHLIQDDGKQLSGLPASGNQAIQHLLDRPWFRRIWVLFALPQSRGLTLIFA
jgi:hypothetical protein